MASRTRNLLSSKKAQFFVLSALIIVSILLLVSRWLEPLSIIDTSSVVLAEESFVFNNVKEKAVSTVQLSNGCEELRYNLDEFNSVLSETFTRKNFKLSLAYEVTQPCVDNILRTKFNLTLDSPSTYITSSFTATK